MPDLAATQSVVTDTTTCISGAESIKSLVNAAYQTTQLDGWHTLQPELYVLDVTYVCIIRVHTKQQTLANASSKHPAVFQE